MIITQFSQSVNPFFYRQNAIKKRAGSAEAIEMTLSSPENQLLFYTQKQNPFNKS
jgi:hypothetical protein